MTAHPDARFPHPGRDASLLRIPGEWPVERLDQLPAPCAGLRVSADPPGGDVAVRISRCGPIHVIDVNAPGARTLTLELPLAPEERLAGLGEQFVQVPQRGHLVDGWNEDLLHVDPRGTYFNAPLLYSSAGY